MSKKALKRAIAQWLHAARNFRYLAGAAATVDEQMYFSAQTAQAYAKASALATTAIF